MEDHSQDKTSLQIIDHSLSYEKIEEKVTNQNRLSQYDQIVYNPYKSESIQTELKIYNDYNSELIKNINRIEPEIHNNDDFNSESMKKKTFQNEKKLVDSKCGNNFHEQPTQVSMAPSRIRSLFIFYDDKMKINAKNDRKKFIQKVYALVFTQMIFTMAIVSTFTMIKTLRENIINYHASLACIIFCIILGVLSIWFKKIVRKYPFNYMFLYLFTAVFSYPIAYYSSHYSVLGVISSIFVASCISGSLALAAYLTKKNFTLIRGLTVGFISGIGFFAVSLSFSYTSISQVGIGMIFISIFVVYLVWDLQLICGGRHSCLSYDDYVIGALLIYVDICALFLYILSTKK
jgi:FtsH-binding integral membrane protein